MNNFILLAEPLQLDLGEKEKIMSTNETPPKEKPTVSIGDMVIELDINKPSERFIITKRYQGYKLFYKMHRKACTYLLGKGTHFETYDKAKEHFDSYIKSNWKHTKQFQIEPVSNFYLSDWKLVVDDGYYPSYDLANKKIVKLKNVPVSIDKYKQGAKLTTVEEMLNKFNEESKKHIAYDERSIAEAKKSIENYQKQINEYEQKMLDRSKKLEQINQCTEMVQGLIEQNTTEAERTVKLIYGKD